MGSPRIANVAVAQIAAARPALYIIGLDFGKAVGLGKFGPFVEIVEAHRVFGKDAVLDRAIGWTQRLEPISLLHVLRYFETAQSLDLPLRRTGPQRIGTPEHVVGAEPL